MKTSSGIRFVIGLVLAGCGSSVAPDDARVAVTPDGGITASSIASCTPILASFTRHSGFYVTGLGYFGTSPNDGLVLDAIGNRFGEAVYHRASTGEAMFTPPEHRILSRDSSWTRDARVVSVTDATGATHGVLEVATTVTNRTLLRTEPPSATAEWAAAALDPAGATLYAAACLDDHLLVRGWDVETRGVLGTASVVGRCSGYDAVSSLVAPSPTHGVVYLAHTEAGALHRIDLVSGDERHVVAHPPADGASEPYVAGILAIAVSPDGTQVLTAGRDAVVRAWDAADLHSVSAPIAAAFGLANVNVYATPFGISPIAYSSAGDLVAHAGVDGSIVLRRADSHAPLATLADPSPREPGVVWHDAPMAIGFARDDSFVVATYSSGLAIWTCPDHAWRSDQHRLEVTLDGPATMSAGATQTFVATHFGTDHVHAHRFFVDGVRVDAPGFAREFDWTAIVGSHEIRVEVDDGIDTGRAAVRVSVAP